ncbi:unnamed protein product, partial [Mesorhabditis spiculigera]
MASKKIIKTQTNLGGSSRTIEHQDPKKSIEDLFTNRFVKKPNKPQLPAAFYQQPTNRGRGSAGHSPVGSSDDGFKSNSQLTLSPQSSTSPGGSAPELVNSLYSAPSSSSHIPQPGIPRPMHKPSYSMSEVSHEIPSYHSRSLSTDATHHQMEPRLGAACSPFGGPPQAPATSWRSDPQIVGGCGGDDGLSSSHGPQPALPPPQQTTSFPPYQHQQPQQHPVHPPPFGHQTDPKDGLGPLPPGWTFGDDGNGCRYYIDHSRQFTTWEDPRLNPAALDHRQNPYGYPPQMPQNQRLMGEYSSANVQQLEAEKSAMRARQESLMRAGLLDPPQMMAGHEQYQQYPHHQPALHHVPPHQRQISADSALPDNMDAMDFTSYGLGMDINPQEFDKYLHISGNR